MKRQYNQSGRSMVEMLGVLAIVGVLSVGGIAGYSKAMNKYKTNQALEQISMITASSKAFFEKNNNYTGLTTQSAINLGLFPEEIISGSEAINIYEGNININSAASNTQYTLSYQATPKSACGTIITQDWTGGDSSKLVSISIQPTKKDLSNDGSATTYTVGTDEFPIQVDKAAEACNGNYNTITWTYF